MKVLRALILSMMIHLILGAGLSRLKVDPWTQKSPKMTQIEILDLTGTDLAKNLDPADKTRVRQMDIPEEEKDLKHEDPLKEEKKRFASERRQDVLHETRSPLSGLTQNRSNLPDPQANSLVKPSVKSHGVRLRQLDLRPEIKIQKGIKQLASHADSDLVTQSAKEAKQEVKAAGDDENRTSNLASRGLISGISTTGEILPDNIRFGSFTALSTDHDTFYGFYSRIEEQIRYHWEREVERVLSSYRRTRASTGDEIWRTQMEFILDKDGNFLRAQMHMGSGLQSLDSTSVIAFHKARQFPNPPTAMIKNGEVHLMYLFEVRNSPVTAQF